MVANVPATDSKRRRSDEDNEAPQKKLSRSADDDKQGDSKGGQRARKSLMVAAGGERRQRRSAARFACCVPDCVSDETSVKANGRSLQFFDMPSDAADRRLRRRWIQAIPELQFAVTVNHKKVCELHFIDGKPTQSHAVPELSLGNDAPRQCASSKKKSKGEKNGDNTAKGEKIRVSAKISTQSPVTGVVANKRPESVNSRIVQSVTATPRTTNQQLVKTPRIINLSSLPVRPLAPASSTSARVHQMKLGINAISTIGADKANIRPRVVRVPIKSFQSVMGEKLRGIQIVTNQGGRTTAHVTQAKSSNAGIFARPSLVNSSSTSTSMAMTKKMPSNGTLPIDRLLSTEKVEPVKKEEEMVVEEEADANVLLGEELPGSNVKCQQSGAVIATVTTIAPRIEAESSVSCADESVFNNNNNNNKNNRLAVDEEQLNAGEENEAKTAVGEEGQKVFESEDRKRMELHSYADISTNNNTNRSFSAAPPLPVDCTMKTGRKTLDSVLQGLSMKQLHDQQRQQMQQRGDDDHPNGSLPYDGTGCSLADSSLVDTDDHHRQKQWEHQSRTDMCTRCADQLPSLRRSLGRLESRLDSMISMARTLCNRQSHNWQHQQQQQQIYNHHQKNSSSDIKTNMDSACGSPNVTEAPVKRVIHIQVPSSGNRSKTSFPPDSNNWQTWEPNSGDSTMIQPFLNSSVEQLLNHNSHTASA